MWQAILREIVEEPFIPISPNYASSLERWDQVARLPVWLWHWAARWIRIRRGEGDNNSLSTSTLPVPDLIIFLFLRITILHWKRTTFVGCLLAAVFLILLSQVNQIAGNWHYVYILVARYKPSGHQVKILESTVYPHPPYLQSTNMGLYGQTNHQYSYHTTCYAEEYFLGIKLEVKNNVSEIFKLTKSLKNVTGYFKIKIEVFRACCGSTQKSLEQIGLPLGLLRKVNKK